MTLRATATGMLTANPQMRTTGAGDPYVTVPMSAPTGEYSYETLKNAGWVCRQIEKSRRRDKLSFSHHYEVAGLEQKESDLLLDKAEENGWNRNELRRQVRHFKSGIGEIPALPPGLYSVIYADPPWRYEHSMTDSRKIENQYPTMELEDICALQVPAAVDSLLFLWATSPKLVESMQVMERRGRSDGLFERSESRQRHQIRIYSRQRQLGGDLHVRAEEIMITIDQYVGPWADSPDWDAIRQEACR